MHQGGDNVPTGFKLLQQHNAMPVRIATEEQFQLFVRGADAVLHQWTALLLVARHRDTQAANQLRNDVIQWFYEDGEVYADELEDYFVDFFEETSRHVSVEDGSCNEVARVLHDMYVSVAKGDASHVERYVASLAVYQAHDPVQQSAFGGMWSGTADGQQVQDNEASDEDDDDDYDEEAEEEEGTTYGASGAAEVEEEVQPQPQQQQKKGNNNSNNNNNKSKKNPFVKSNDGWCTVQRKR